MRINNEGVFGHEGIFKNLNTARPWGHYGLYADNETTTVKILYLKPGQRLSMQMHFKRDQFYYLIDPDFIVEHSVLPTPTEVVGDIEKLREWARDNIIICQDLKGGEMFGFEREHLHRLTYVGNREYGRCLDLAFGENDEEDIIRVHDLYGRDEKEKK